MASFDDCLRNMIDADVINKDEADELGATFKRMRDKHAASASAEEAEILAKDELVRLLEKTASHKKRIALLTVQARRRITRDLQQFRDGRGDPDMGLAALNLLEHYGRAGYSSVAGRGKAILGMAHADMEALMHEFRRAWFTGKRMNRAGLDNVVREAFGETTGDTTAKGLADAWAKVSDDLRQRFNLAGGAIGKLESWGMPQAHNRLALLRRGKDAWMADILPRLAPERMRHPLTADPVAPTELPDMLSHVYDSIIEDGWNTREPSATPFGRGAIAKQRADSRFLVFKNADAWLQYQREYGSGDVFASMMGHINGMARDIAAMEILGPNPRSQLEWIKQTIQKETAKAENGKPSLMKKGRYLGSSMRTTAAITLRELDGLYEELRGGATPQGERLAAVGAGIRNWLVAAKLGGATLSAVTGDPVTMAIAKKFIGLPAANTLHSIARQFGELSKREAVAAGLINEEAAHVLREQARYAGSLAGPEWTRWLPDRVMAWNGLSAWTTAAKHAFGREMQAFAGHRLDGPWEALPEEFRRAAEGYGIGAEDWALMRRAPAQQIAEARFLRPQDIAALDDPQAREVAERWLEMILSETEYAIPSGTARGRAALIAGAPAGSWKGEFWRSALMFKSFGLSVAHLQSARVAGELGAGRGARGAAYVGGALITMTLGGALGIWLKDIAAGKEPQKPDNTGFWIAALAQGGGLGIFGDFVFADFSRFGSSFQTTLAGPAVGAVADVWNATGGQAIKLLRGEETNLSDQSLRLLRNYTPGGTLWYLRTAYNRVVLDQLQYLTDPNASRRFKRQAQNLRNERDQGYWWAPGAAVPGVAP